MAGWLEIVNQRVSLLLNGLVNVLSVLSLLRPCFQSQKSSPTLPPNKYGSSRDEQIRPKHPAHQLFYVRHEIPICWRKYLKVLHLKQHSSTVIKLVLLPSPFDDFYSNNEKPGVQHCSVRANQFQSLAASWLGNPRTFSHHCRRQRDHYGGRQGAHGEEGSLQTLRLIEKRNSSCWRAPFFERTDFALFLLTLQVSIATTFL